MKFDPDLTPKRAHTKLTAKRKLREKKGKAKYDIKYLPSLSQVIRQQQLLIILIALIENQFLIRFKVLCAVTTKSIK